MINTSPEQPQSFIRPPLASDVSPLKAFLHNFYGLGRTNVLHHILYPSEKSIEQRLQKIWATVYTTTFTDLEKAKEQISNSLDNIHPRARLKYETQIKNAPSILKIQELAQTSFTQSEKTGKELYIDISKFLDSKLQDSVASSIQMNVRKFLRKIIAGCTPSEGEEVQTLETIKSNIQIPEICTRNPIFMEKYQKLQEASDIEALLRCAENLNGTLISDLSFLKPKYSTERERILHRLQTTWEDLKRGTFEDPQAAFAFVEERLRDLGLPGITELYMKDLSSARSMGHIQKRAESYLKDLDSIKGPSNLFSISDGMIGYPKLIDWSRSKQILGFMKYLGSDEEMDYHRIYSFLLPPASSEAETPKSFTPRVADGSMLTQSFPLSYTHPYPLNRKEPISEDKTEYIQYLNSFMATANTPRSFYRGNTGANITSENSFQNLVQTNPLGFFEKVKGENLSKFLLSKYATLTPEEKKSLFFHLGSIVFLDFTLGNLDRLICINPENPSWDDTTDCNFGNLMISEDKTALYAIDNGIGDGKNVSQTEEQKAEMNSKYLDFLSNTFSQDNPEQIITENLLRILKISITNLKEDLDIQDDEDGGESGNTNLAHLDQLKEDLSNIILVQDPLVRGMQFMKIHLLDKAVQAWAQEPFKDTLKEAVQSTVQERLNILSRLNSTQPV